LLSLDITTATSLLIGDWSLVGVSNSKSLILTKNIGILLDSHENYRQSG